MSQWRAYSDDGKGYAIGFRAQDLAQLPVKILKVLYERKEQIDEMKSIIRAIYEAEKTEGEKFGSNFLNTCLSLAFDLAAYKNPAFEEEREVRLVHVLTFEASNNSLRLNDTGGYAFGEEYKGGTVSFRMRDNIPVAFIELDFSNGGRINPIKEVIVGPKNQGLLSAISVYLETIDLGSVEIKKSRASYR